LKTRSTTHQNRTELWVDPYLYLWDPLQAEVVKLRFFIGLKNDETADILGLSEKTVRRYWEHAKAWLYERMRTR